MRNIAISTLDYIIQTLHVSLVYFALHRTELHYSVASTHKTQFYQYHIILCVTLQIHFINAQYFTFTVFCFTSCHLTVAILIYALPKRHHTLLNSTIPLRYSSIHYQYSTSDHSTKQGLHFMTPYRRARYYTITELHWTLLSHHNRVHYWTMPLLHITPPNRTTPKQHLTIQLRHDSIYYYTLA